MMKNTFDKQTHICNTKCCQTLRALWIEKKRKCNSSWEGSALYCPSFFLWYYISSYVQ